MVSRAVTRALHTDTAQASRPVTMPSMEDEDECQNNVNKRVVELVEMAELAFARRQFQKSLDGTHQVLRQQRRREICGTKRETQLDMVESSSVPCLGWDTTRKRGRNRAWGVDYGSDRRITPQDRAAAVALQSIYELSKVNVDKKDAHRLQEQLEPFVKYYFYDNDETETRHCPSTMPLQLLVVWVQFCISIGSSSNSGWPEAVSVAFSTSLEVLSQLLPRLSSDHNQSTLQPSSAVCNSVVMDQCDDLMDALFLQILVRLGDETDTDSSRQNDLISHVMNRLFLPSLQTEAPIIHPKFGSRDEHEPFLKLLPQANPNMVVLLLAELERVAVQTLPGLLSQRMEEVVYQLSLLANTVHQSHETRANNHMNENDDTMERRAIGSQHVDHGENHHVSSSSSWQDFVQHQIVDPLWNSDNRWTNRAQLAAVGALTYMTWKKRRRMGAMGHGLFVAPLREIMQAACIIASPTTTS